MKDSIRVKVWYVWTSDYRGNPSWNVFKSFAEEDAHKVAEFLGSLPSCGSSVVGEQGLPTKYIVEETTDYIYGGEEEFNRINLLVQGKMIRI